MNKKKNRSDTLTHLIILSIVIMIACIIFEQRMCELTSVHKQRREIHPPQIDNVVTIILRHNLHSPTNHIQRT